MSGTIATDATLSATGTITLSAIAPARIAATYTSNGSISEKEGTILVNSSTGIALTLAAPTSGTDDGKVLQIVDVSPIGSASSGNSVTTSNDSYGDGGSGQNAWNELVFTVNQGTLTSIAAKLFAYQGHWYLIQANGSVSKYYN